MGSSLAEQLKKLALPQSSLIVQEKKRVSFLYSPQEAANFDRALILSQAVAAIAELKRINQEFGEFEHTLFSEDSLSLSRSVESKEVNKKLDKAIQRFLLKLSPYFLLKPAHATLEWLVCRFQIHLFNVDDLMMLIMPYHETDLFVRGLQLIDTSDPTSKWHWLHPIKRPAVPLSKKTLLNHCAADSGFLSFICEMLLKSVKVHKTKPTVISTIYSFCCTAIVGSLEYTRSPTEVQVTHILKVLFKGLKSPIPDYAASCFIITSQVARKSQLSRQLLDELIFHISKNPEKTVRRDAVLLLVLLFQTQQELTTCEGRTLLNLMKWDFSQYVAEIAQSGIQIVKFLSAVISECFNQMKFEEHTFEVLLFLKNICTDVTFDKNLAAVIIRIIVTCCDPELFKINTNYEMITTLLEQLEYKYSDAFDSTINNLVKHKSTSDHCRKILELTPGISVHLCTAKVLTNLMHPSEHQRIQGLNFVRSKFSELKAKEKNFLHDTLIERLHDEQTGVVKAVLSFELDKLLEILELDVLLTNLTELAYKCWKAKEKCWLSVAEAVISILCSKQIFDLIDNHATIFLAILPYLLPTYNDQLKLSKYVLTTYFGKQDYVQPLLKELDAVKEVSSYQFSSFTLKLISESPFTSDINWLISQLDKLFLEEECVIKKYILISQLKCLLNKTTHQERNSILDIIVDQPKTQKVFLIASTDSQKLIDNLKEEIFPVDAILEFTQQLIKLNKLPQELKHNGWWDLLGLIHKSEVAHEAVNVIRVFEILIQGCSIKKKLSKVYVEYLNEFFQEYFPLLPLKMSFLSNLFVGHEIRLQGNAHSSISPELQLRSLKLAVALVEKSTNENSWIFQENNIISAILIAISCKMKPIRQAALEILDVIERKFGGSSEHSFMFFVKELLIRREGLLIDSEQLSVALYMLFSSDIEVQSLLNEKISGHMKNVFSRILNVITSKDTPPHVSSALLKITSHLNSENIFLKLIPMGNSMYEEFKGKTLDVYRSTILRHILEKINVVTCHCLRQELPWKFFTSVILDFRTVFISENEQSTFPTLLAMNQISKELFEKLPDKQLAILSLLVEISTETDLPEVSSAVSQTVKGLIIHCRSIIPILESMANVTNISPQAVTTKSNKIRRRAPSIELLRQPEWEKGVTLLELIQQKKKLNAVEQLLPVLFSVLDKCLLFEEQAPLEYVKQLVLSLLLHCCQKLSPNGTPVSPDILSEDQFNVELVVQCIRGTQNPQTHHHALQVLAHMGGMVPNQVLHNVMPVFTFMGSSIMRQEDAYSLQIISKILESIIPILLKAGQSGAFTAKMKASVEVVVANILRVFVDALLDIPDHRCLSLLLKLLQTLGEEKYFWLFFILVAESEVFRGKEDESKSFVSKRYNTKEKEIPKRLDILLNLSKEFSPAIILQNAVYVIQYLLRLPTEIYEDNKQRHSKPDPIDIALFDFTKHSDKLLRHFRYIVVTFLSAQLSLTTLVEQIASMNEDELMNLGNLYKESIVGALQFVQLASRQTDQNITKPTGKYWRAMLNQACFILEKVNCLLPYDMFLQVVRGLMDCKMLAVQRKVLDLLNEKLHQSEFCSSVNEEQLLSLLSPLTKIVMEKSAEKDDSIKYLEVEINQQTALLSLKLIARVLAHKHPEPFKEVLEMSTKILKSDLPHENIMAAVMLCLAELCQALRAHAIVCLPKFMPTVMSIMHKQIDSTRSDIVILAFLTAINKIIESLFNFLSPYLVDLLVEVTVFTSQFMAELETNKTAPVVQKLKTIRENLSTLISLRVLIPAVGECYTVLLDKKKYQAISPLMLILSECIKSKSTEELTKLQVHFRTLFVLALALREVCGDDPCLEKAVFYAEHSVVEAVIALILKQSENSFRPFYNDIFHWAFTVKEHKNRLITFFRLTKEISANLQGLFHHFCGSLLKSAVKLLDQNNNSKQITPFYGEDDVSDKKTALLLEYILSTLNNLFIYDTRRFVNKEKFDMLMQPLVDQLENTAGSSTYFKRGKEILVPTIANFAGCISDDSLWKTLNYQILLKMRNSLQQVRILALEALCAVARKLGDNFMPLLPESIPFLSELLEDEEVEEECRKTVQDLEEILGESIQKYF